MKYSIKSIACLILICTFIFSFCACGETPMSTVSCDEGHDLVQVGYTAPTCQTIGAKVYTCSRCGYTETETLFPIDHDFQEKSIIPSTCTEKGSRLLECTMCHTPKEEEIPCCDHNYEHKTIAPTCFTDGEDFDECKVCGTKINLVTTPKYTHKFSSKSYDDYSRCELCGVGSALYKVTKIQGYVHNDSRTIYCFCVFMDIDRPSADYPIPIPDAIPTPKNYKIISTCKESQGAANARMIRDLVCSIDGLPKMSDGPSFIYFEKLGNYRVSYRNGGSASVTFNIQWDPSTQEPYECEYPTLFSIEFTPDICDWIEV